MIARVESPEARARIARTILDSLPDWFGIPESVDEYVRACRDLPVWAAVEDGRCLGFIAMRRTSPCAAEIHVTGVLPTATAGESGGRCLRRWSGRPGRWG